MKKYLSKITIFFSIFWFCLKKAIVDTIDHDGVEHAGYLSFLTILSIFPFLILFISIAGIFGATELGADLVKILLNQIPTGGRGMLNVRLQEIISGPPQSLLTIAIIGAIWTASSTVDGLKTIFNRAYRVTTPPTYIFRRLASIVEFLLITIFVLTSMVLLVALPLIVDFAERLISIDLSAYHSTFNKIRLLPTAIILFFAISSIYYILPNIKQRFLTVAPGAFCVVIAWFIVGSLFSLYLQNFNQVNLIYGSLASFVVALFFFYIIAMILIWGAEFNHCFIEKLGIKCEEKES